jgi:hypothetical protein
MRLAASVMLTAVGLHSSVGGSVGGSGGGNWVRCTRHAIGAEAVHCAGNPSHAKGKQGNANPYGITKNKKN